MIGLASSVVQRKITPQYSVALSVTVQGGRRQLLRLQDTDIFQNIYPNLLLMQAHVSTESRSVSNGMYESLLHGNREMPRLHRQHQPESPEIVDCFGNHERALRTAEGELVGVTPAAAPLLAE